MIRTPICRLLDIEHPIALGGVGSAASPRLMAAVSRAGGLAAVGCGCLGPEQIREHTAAIRKDTTTPFGLNCLMFDTLDNATAALELQPSVMQSMWARVEPELTRHFDRTHRSRAEALTKLRVARWSDDVDEGPLSVGEDAGLIHDIASAARIVTRIAQESEEILSRRLSRLSRRCTLTTNQN